MTTESPPPGPSAATYVVVWLALAALAGISLLAASVSLGPWNVVLAFAIAAVKAGLVLGIFMQLVHGRPLHRVVIAVAFGFVVVIILGVMADVGTRDVAGPDLEER